MKARKIHRMLVPFAAAPLLLTALSGSLYSALLSQGIDAFWLLKMHSGTFGPLNLQPYYSVLLGGSTCVLIGSGISLLLPRRQGQRRPHQ